VATKKKAVKKTTKKATPRKRNVGKFFVLVWNTAGYKGDPLECHVMKTGHGYRAATQRFVSVDAAQTAIQEMEKKALSRPSRPKKYTLVETRGDVTATIEVKLATKLRECGSTREKR